MSFFKKIVLVVLGFAIVLSCLSIVKLNSSGKSTNKDIDDNIVSTPTVAEVCGELRTAFIKSSSSSLNFKNCLALSDSSIEVDVWSSIDKPIKPELVKNFNDQNLPSAQAKSMCETFFRSFPILKNAKFVVLADDQNSVLMNFDMTPDVCNQATSKSLNELSNQDVNANTADGTNVESKANNADSTNVESKANNADSTNVESKANKADSTNAESKEKILNSTDIASEGKGVNQHETKDQNNQAPIEEKNSTEGKKEELTDNDKKVLAEGAIPTQGDK